MFSLITITYNRRHTVDRLWRSLKRMEKQNFEWIVVDNCSSDGTESLIKSWAKYAAFNLKYRRLPANRGKAAALNFSKSLVDGNYVIVVDDDDTLFDHVFDSIDYYIESTAFRERKDVGAIAFRDVTERGELFGEILPEELMESTLLDVRYVHKCKTYDLCMVMKTSVFLEFEHIELPPPNTTLRVEFNTELIGSIRLFLLIYHLKLHIAMIWFSVQKTEFRHILHDDIHTQNICGAGSQSAKTLIISFMIPAIL